MAVQALGAAPVPVYADSVADEIAFVLSHAAARFAIAQDQEQVDKLLSVSERLPKLERIFYDERKGLRDYDHTRLHSIETVSADGAEALAADARTREWLDAEIAGGSGEDVSAILYTSGTTGRPKGVLLSAERSVRAAQSTVAFDRLTESDEVLAYLPLAWVGDHYMTYAQGLVAGWCIACPESVETVQENLREIGPTFYFAPPRVFENLLTATMVRMEDAGALQRRMFHFFIQVARRYGERILNGQRVGLGGRLLYGLGRLLVYAPLKNRLGFSRIRVAYTAGEAIGPDLFSFYRSLGMNLKQFYGQTESFLYLTAQADGEIRPDTVGGVLPEVEIRLAENGEIQFKSPGQFIAYFRDDERTAEAVTADGYVRTGDAGFFDASGQLKIIDRARDVGRLKNGLLFPPKYIENKLKFYANIREAVAFGDGRDCVTCFLNIDLTAVGNWAERHGITYGSYQELAGNERVYDLLQSHIEQVNRDLAAEPGMEGLQIRRFLVLHKELDADDGELTRTQKVRRRFIAERYAKLIEALYSGAGEADIATEVTFEDGRKGMISARVRIRDLSPHSPTALDKAA